MGGETVTEHDEQVGLFNFLRYMEPKHPALKWIHAIPNGGQRHKAVAQKMKAEGVKAGVLDIFVPLARNGYHGMYVEMKFGKNTMTDNQKNFRDFVIAEGFLVVVCYNWIEAARKIFWYLEYELPEELA